MKAVGLKSTASAPRSSSGHGRKDSEPGFPVAGAIGAELSRHVAAMESVLQEFQHARYISRAELATLRRALDGVQRITKQSQQLARLAGGRLRQSHERLSLHEITAQVLKDKARSFSRAGGEVEPHLRSVDVIVDPGLLLSLLETAVDWISQRGRRLQLWLGIKNWPEHAVLLLRARPLISTSGTARDDNAAGSDDLEWFLLLQLAHAAGVMVARQVAPEQTELSLEFPRTVRQLEGLTALEVDTRESALGESTRPLAGHRMLLVSDDDRLRREINDLCESMGIAVDATPTTRQATRFCELEQPHIVVVDERLHDHVFDELRQDLLVHNVNFPFIEIAKGDNIVEISSWVGDRMSRISRDALHGQLPSILVMELAKGA